MAIPMTTKVREAGHALALLLSADDFGYDSDVLPVLHAGCSTEAIGGSGADQIGNITVKQQLHRVSNRKQDFEIIEERYGINLRDGEM